MQDLMNFHFHTNTLGLSSLKSEIQMLQPGHQAVVVAQ